MTREAELVQALVAMSDTLVEDFDVIDTLTTLTDQCVHLLGISAAGVMLASPPGELRLVASSSEAMRVLELFELQHDEGPCLDAYRTGQPVEHEVLHADSGPWPTFATVSLQAGFQSVCALPMRLRHATIGALNLFNKSPDRISSRDLAVSQAFADMATIAVLQHRAVSEAQILNEQLSGALNSRVTIEQAKGVIAERAGVDMTEAFARLRRYARNHNLKLTDVALSAVDGTLDATAWEN